MVDPVHTQTVSGISQSDFNILSNLDFLENDIRYTTRVVQHLVCQIFVFRKMYKITVVCIQLVVVA